MDLEDVYQYTTITEQNTIRIILLQPSQDLDAEVQCSLINVELHSDDIINNYTALSYVWGDQSDVRVVSVDGKRLQITASLECALRHIRDSRRVHHVWADGVCLYVDRYRTKYRGNLRLGPLFSKGFRCALVELIYRFLLIPPILWLDLRIVALEYVNFSLTQSEVA
jgi:hypothetical protein